MKVKAVTKPDIYIPTFKSQETTYKRGRKDIKEPWVPAMTGLLHC